VHNLFDSSCYRSGSSQQVSGFESSLQKWPLLMLLCTACKLSHQMVSQACNDIIVYRTTIRMSMHHVIVTACKLSHQMVSQACSDIIVYWTTIRMSMHHSLLQLLKNICKRLLCMWWKVTFHHCRRWFLSIAWVYITWGDQGTSTQNFKWRHWCKLPPRFSK